MKNNLKKYLLFPTLSILLFLTIAEAVLILFDIDPHPRGVDFTVNRAPDFPEAFLKDHDLFWTMHPDRYIQSDFFLGTSYQINRQGFRDDDFILQKSGLRIAVLGNSCSFGWRVNRDESYAGLIESSLIQQPGLEKAEVYNFSVPGYSSYQGKVNFEKNVLAYKPDILLITFGWNDQRFAAFDRPDKDQIMPSEFYLDIYNFLARFRFYRLVKATVFSIIPAAEPMVNTNNQAKLRVSLSDFEDNLTAIISASKKANIRVILLTSPIPSIEKYYRIEAKSVMHQLHYNFNQVTSQTAARQSVGLVDLAGIFDRYDDLFDNVKTDPFHFNVKGHRRAATEILQFLTDGDYLK